MIGFRGLITGAIAALTLAGCASEMPMDNGPAPQVTSRADMLSTHLPPMSTFSGTSITPATRPNSEIARDFLDLSFYLESGRALPVLSRFETPISLRVTGRAPNSLRTDLAHLIDRLRREAHIDIHQVEASAPAAITLQVIPKRVMQSLVPSAACFVAPNVSSWDEYKAKRSTSANDWTLITERKHMALFIPGDVAPQEIRDCLHEDLAQALGPVNDLYRLTDSIFNDDNFQAVLTGFDMLVLRAYYDPALHSGMSRQEVAARLPAILQRLNPRGGSGVPLHSALAPDAWKKSIIRALSAGGSLTARQNAARQAVTLARSYGWQDTRLAISLFAMGRLNIRTNSDIALASFREAEAIYSRSPGTALQAAHMAVQLAAHELAIGNGETAIRIVDQQISAVTRAENAALLATLMMIKAEALDLTGRSTQAQLVRLDSLGWARYGFGSKAEVNARLSEIAAIPPGRG
ncbi:MAG: DUF2927 domain-containing protein [Maritimibacter sp.]